MSELKALRDYVPAKLYDAGGRLFYDNGKPAMWYVYYKQRNPATGQMLPFKERKGINYLKSVRERRRKGKLLVEVINESLRDGTINHFNSQVKVLLIEQLQKEVDLKKNFLRHRTYQSYEYARKMLTAWLKEKRFDSMQPKEFTRNHAQMFCDYLTLVKNYKGKTFNVMKSFVSVLFNSMADKDIIIDNPFRRIKSQRQAVGKNIAFSETQKQKLIQHLKQHNPQLYLVTQFIYFCYIRPAELMRLQVRNVDLKGRKIVIYPDQSKTHRQEQVEIPDAFFPLVQSMNLEKYNDNDFLFSRGFEVGDRPLGRNSITQAHLKVLRKLKFTSDYTLYSWKHSGCVNAKQQGIDVYDIMRQLRHTSLDHTMIYLKSLGLVRNEQFASKMK